MQRFYKSSYFLPLIISFILFVIPFFWLKPGQIDIGGDSTRLYFYDPLNFLINNSLYLSETISLTSRSFWPQFYTLPYAAMLLLLKNLINSSFLLVSLFNGIKVSVSFLSVYLIIRTLLQNSYKEKKELFLQLPSILGGLLYTTAPIIIGNYDKALISHDQIFLNPLCFYFLLCYFIKQKFRFLVYFLLTTIFFAHNFAWASAPPILAFYPLILIFLLLYVILVLKKNIIYRHLLIASILFICLHAFHLFPEAYSLLSPNSYFNQRVFGQSAVQDDLNYFFAILPLAKLSNNLLLYASFKQFILFFIVSPFFLLLGLCFNKGKDKTLFLIGIFFLLTLYLVTANITDLGLKLYSVLFYIPIFSVFRNFIGQWAFIFTFFYALLFGQAIYYLFKKVNTIIVLFVISLIIGLSFILTSWDFFTGGRVNVTLNQTNIKIPLVMDPQYEKTLSYIRSLKDDGAFISFPFTDCCYTVIHGVNNGAYVGPSPITTLTGKLDYDGYQRISPFGEVFFKFTKDKNYKGIKKLLGLLNIKYIYYNDNPNIYSPAFPGDPYNYSYTVFPKTQAEYKKLVEKISAKEIYHQGTYHVYVTDSNYFHPVFYTAEYMKTYQRPQTELYNLKDPFFDFSPQANDVYIVKDECLTIFSKSICNKREDHLIKKPTIKFNIIDPTTYQLHVHNANGPYLLVLSDSFSSDWNLSLARATISEDIWIPDSLPQRHILANGYGNAWYIIPKDVGYKSDYTLTIQLRGQRIFYIGALVSLITLFVGIIFGIFFLFRK